MALFFCDYFKPRPAVSQAEAAARAAAEALFKK